MLGLFWEELIVGTFFFLSPLENTPACLHPIGPTLKKKKSSLFLIVYLDHE
jgi:hypothetical protein